MAYVAQSDLAGKIPPAMIVAALDDNADGTADTGVWDALAADVERAINGRLAPRYSVPFAAPLPDLIVDAALLFACEAIYTRRGMAGDKQNPFAAEADAMRERLEKLGRGDGSLPGVVPARAGGAVIAEPTKTGQSNGRLLV
jgi:phage gp36-like protein